MPKSGIRVLFIGKAGDPFSERAAGFTRSVFKDPVIVFSSRNEPYPPSLNDWKGDLIISYLSQWILPGELLSNASIAAINFHPGPPEYPGIGCTNFAVYNGEKEYGISCHHMLAKVDTGELVAVKRFPIHEDDTVYTITQRSYQYIYDTFEEVMLSLIKEGKLPTTSETWKRLPYTRKQLNELCTLTPEMPADEIQRRLKATTFGDKVWAEVVTPGRKWPYELAKEQGIISE